MTAADLGAAVRVAEAVHPAYPEDPAVFADRLRLSAATCLVLAGPDGIAGYAIAHPWRFGPPPALNTRLARLPADADVLHLHDLALLPHARGGGHGAAALRRLGPGRMTLVAVGRSLPFWRRQGFQAVEGAPGLDSYGAGARLMVRDTATGGAGRDNLHADIREE